MSWFGFKGGGVSEGLVLKQLKAYNNRLGMPTIGFKAKILALLRKNESLKRGEGPRGWEEEEKYSFKN